MGEILSKDTINLLKNEQVRVAVRTMVESDHSPGPVSVEIKSPTGGAETTVVNLRIAST